MPLTVIVPVHGCPALLADCLIAIRRSNVQPNEVIVVDDGSADAREIAAVAASAGARLARFDCRMGPAAARNRGAEQATGDTLIFIDADVNVHQNTLEQMAAALAEDPGLAGVFGCYDANPVVNSLVSSYRNLLHHYVHQTSRRQAVTFWAGCGALRKAAFEAAGGFDASYAEPSIEDVELGLRLTSQGHRIELRAEIQCQHAKDWTLGSFLRTDLWQRAVPWTELLLTRPGGLPQDLNFRWSQRLSVGLAVTLALGLLLSFLWPRPGAILAAASTVALLWLNRAFLAFLSRARGPAFALGSFPLHVLHYLASALGFALGVLRALSRALTGSPAGRTRLPSPTGGAVPNVRLAFGLTLFAAAMLAATLGSLGWACSALAFSLAAAVRRPFWRLAWLMAGSSLAAVAIFVSYWFHGAPTNDEFTPPGWSQPDLIVGNTMVPSRTTRWRRNVAGRRIFDVQMSSDQHGLRVTPPAPSAERSIVFFGCSFTFGHGVNDTETFPYQTAVQTGGKYSVYNFALNGYGPNQMLALLESGRVKQIVAQPPTLVVYLAIQDHMWRRAGVGMPEWQQRDPYYVLNESGEIVRAGYLKDRPRPSLVPRPLYDWFDRSHLLQLLPPSPQAARAFAKTVDKSRALVQQMYPNSRFEVLFWRHLGVGRVRDELAEAALAAERLPVTVTSTFLPGDPETYTLAGRLEPHPNRLANSRIATHIVTHFLPAMRKGGL